MKRPLFAVLALILAVGLQSQAARAQDSSNFFSQLIYGNQDKKLAPPGIGLGIAAGIGSYYLSMKRGYPGTRIMSYGVAYGATTAGCIVVYPILATAWINRPLTPREAYIGFANCALPIVGGWIVDASLPHTAWYDGTPEPVAHHHHHK
jgi:hypothetical protein